MTIEIQELSKGEYNKILEAVIVSLQSKGFKATRMDDIASGLGMSKRTLYEIFENKDDMIFNAIKYFRRKQIHQITRIFKTSDNVLEAVIKTILLHQQVIKNSSPVFYNELNSYAQKFKEFFHDDSNRDNEQEFLSMLEQGVQQGVFKSNKDYRLTMKIFMIQMESLKRCEDLIPCDIRPWQIYTTISLNFLRSIATAKGLEILENYISNYDLENEEYNHEILNDQINESR